MADSIWDAGKGGSSKPSGTAKADAPPSIWGAGGKKTKKKSGGVLGRIKGAGKGLLGAVANTLGAPQQMLFKGTQAINDLSQGEFGAAKDAALGVLGEAATLGQAGGDVDFAHVLRQHRKDGTNYAVKLPKGVNTGVGLVADPLNFTTFGTGTVARNATKVLAKELGTEAAERLARQGLTKGLSQAEKSTLRTALIRRAEQNHAKNATKTAERQIAALTKRGRGGIGLHVPGTDIGTTLVSGRTLGRVADASVSVGGRELGINAAKKAAKTSGPGQALRKAFVPGAEVAAKRGDDAAAQLLDVIRTGSAKTANDVDDVVTRWNAAAQDLKETAGLKFGKAEDALVHQALESGDLAGAKAANPKLARVLNTADSLRTQTDADLRAAGVLSDGVEMVDDVPISARRDLETFAHRTFTEDVVKAQGRAKKDALYEGKGLSSAGNPGSAKARTIAPNHSTEAIQGAFDDLHAGRKVADPDLAKAAKYFAKELKLPAGTKLYDQSATRSLIEAGVDAKRALGAKQTLDDIRAITDDAGEGILLSADDVAAGADLPEDWVTHKFGKLGTYHAPPEVMSELTKFMAVIGQDDVVRKWEKFIDQWNRWWKGQVTASLPGGFMFASRNARSNVMLTFADGMSPKWFATGGAFQLKVRGVVKNNAAAIADEGVEKVMKRELGDRDFAIWKAARDNGVIGDGFYNIDLSEAPEIKAAGMPKGGGKLKRGARFVAGSHGTLAVKGRALNQMVEQHARMSHFLYSIDRLGDLGEAAARTNTVLFDYSRLTPFEQRVVKKIMPFWTFMRKNTPGQFRAFVENPARYALPEKLSRAVSEPLDEDAPEYQKRAGSHKSRLPGLGGMILTPERPFQAAVNSLEPLAQLGAALAPGDQGAIEPEKGVPQAFRTLVSQVGGGPAAAAKYVIDEGTGTSSFTGFKLKEEERRQRGQVAAFPALGRAPVLTGRLPKALVTQRQKDKAKARTLAQIASALGIKLEADD